MIPLALAGTAQTIRVVAAVVVVALVALAGQRIVTWRASHHALRATQDALESRTADLQRCTADAAVVAQAAARAATQAERQRAADAATAQRIADALETDLAAADGRARDLADRLRRYQARRCPGPVPGAAETPGNAPEPAGEPAGDAQAGAGAVDRATADVLTACASDAQRLGAWQRWWAEVSGRE